MSYPQLHILRQLSLLGLLLGVPLKVPINSFDHGKGFHVVLTHLNIGYMVVKVCIYCEGNYCALMSCDHTFCIGVKHNMVPNVL